MARIKRKKKSINKKVRNATPLKINGIQFRSKLEVYCYKALKAAKIYFEYEQHKFILIEPFEFNNDSYEVIKAKGINIYDKKSSKIRATTYTPDFVNIKDKWIIETKGQPNDAFPIKWKLFKQYLIKNNLEYDLYMPRNHKQIDETIKLIKHDKSTNNFR